MTFEIYKLEWILSRHTFGNTTRSGKLARLPCKTLLMMPQKDWRCE